LLEISGQRPAAGDARGRRGAVRPGRNGARLPPTV